MRGTLRASVRGPRGVRMGRVPDTRSRRHLIYFHSIPEAVLLYRDVHFIAGKGTLSQVVGCWPSHSVLSDRAGI